MDGEATTSEATTFAWGCNIKEITKYNLQTPDSDRQTETSLHVK